MRAQLVAMISLAEAAHVADEPETWDGPTYDALGMLFAVQDAVKKFHQAPMCAWWDRSPDGGMVPQADFQTSTSRSPSMIRSS
ncbi:hypothetical protein HMP09_2358 [Sphingomonas sp. HMP9]|uniref:hypothetical protein n=1 Tax=Sphingomonas sp. HMP9 TaxID=1517554 RepID=UPI001596F8F2|nr:hypothetical protein [Sphingomonas sp. HMP9]BCA63124.1 hypothetical protein HMP09_2358 [Sphingomonas sp. HMP9]